MIAVSLLAILVTIFSSGGASANHASVPAVWLDMDGDGLQEADEPGLRSVSVIVTDSSGVRVSAGSTDGDGHWTVPSLAPGTYTIRYIPARLYGLTVSPRAQGGDDTADSDGFDVTGGGSTAIAEITITTTGTGFPADLDQGFVPSVLFVGGTWIDDGDHVSGGAGDTQANGVEVYVQEWNADDQEWMGMLLVSTTSVNLNPSADGTDKPSRYMFPFDPSKLIDEEINPDGEFRLVFAPPECTIDREQWSPVFRSNHGDDETIDSDGEIRPESDDLPATDVYSAADVTSPMQWIDQGFQPCRNISILAPRGTVWCDDGDGRKEDGELGLGGILVELIDPAGDVVSRSLSSLFVPSGEAEWSTNAGQVSQYGPLPSRTPYTVRFVLPSGVILSPANIGSDYGDSDATLVDGVAQIGGLQLRINNEDSRPRFDVGVICSDEVIGAVGDHVWVDDIRNSVQDAAGDTGMEGNSYGFVSLERYVDESDAWLSAAAATFSALSDNDYLLTPVVAGHYRLQWSWHTINNSSPYDLVVPNQGGDDAVDSDAIESDVPGIAYGAEFDLAPGQTDLTWDIGLQRPGGFLQILKATSDDRASFLDGAVFRIENDDLTVTASVQTGADGRAPLVSLPSGSYTVTETLAPVGMLLDATPQTVSVDPTHAFEVPVEISLTNEPVLEEIVLRKEVDDPNYSGDLSGFSYTLTGPSGEFEIVTSSDGTARVVDVVPGTYTFVETASESDLFLIDPTPFTVIVDRGGLTTHEVSHTNQLAPPDTAALFALGDHVWMDSDNDGVLSDLEVGIAGLAVHLFVDGDGDGQPDDVNGDRLIDVGDALTVTTTNSAGRYLFDDLPAGAYVVGLPPAEWDVGGLLYATLPSSGADAANDLDDVADGVAGPDGYVISGTATFVAGVAAGHPEEPMTNRRVDFGVWRPQLDLALTKTLTSGTASVGSTAVFELVVTNEGDVDAGSIELVDYLPSGLELTDADWVLTSDGSAIMALDDVVLAPGKSVTVEITTKVIVAGDQQNDAEITTADAMVAGTSLVMPNGQSIPDVDSVADATNTDSVTEDDHDTAVFSIRVTSPLAFTGLSTHKTVGYAITVLLFGIMFVMAGFFLRRRAH